LLALYEGIWQKHHAGTVSGIHGTDPGKYLNLLKDDY